MAEDIRIVKRAYRTKFKNKRQQMNSDDKMIYDKKIYDRVINLWSFRNNDTVFLYVSTEIEVDTIALIEYSLSCGKKVAVPRCADSKGTMYFYYIDSLSSLRPGHFGVLEPDNDEEHLVTDLSGGLCILPALGFDRSGYRLGYGKGYYDRFLSKFGGDTVGLCYEDCMIESLPHGKYDKAVSAIVTDKSVIIL